MKTRSCIISESETTRWHKVTFTLDFLDFLAQKGLKYNQGNGKWN